jgi:hypothetical protein
MSISNFLEDKLLDATRGVSYAAAGTYLQLHTGDPGETGAANVATESSRQSVSFGAASGGSMASSGTVEWTNVAGTETLSHWSLWDASSSGNCLWSGQLASSANVVAGDTFQITLLTLTLD